MIAHNVEVRSSLVDLRPQRVVLRPNFWSRNRRLLSIILACVIFSGSLTFGALWMRVGVFSSPSRTGVVSTEKPQRHVSGGLGLRVQAENDRLLLSWDREAAAVENAANGSLIIDDGSSHRQIQLDSEQVANGSVLYRPRSDDVSFRLQVTTDKGATAQDTVRVLGDPSVPMMNHVARISVPQPDAPVASGIIDPGPKTLSASAAADFAPSATPVALVVPKTDNADAPVPSKVVSNPFLAKAPIDVDLPGPSASLEFPQLVPKPFPVPQTVAPSDLSYRPPEPLKRVTPSLRSTELGTLGSGFETDLRVHIDERGHVAGVSILKGGFNSIFNALVMQAAQAWTFTPARLHGKVVPSDYVIVFKFKTSKS